MSFSNIKEAELQLIKSFNERGIKITKKESIIVNHSKYGTPIYNTRVYTEDSVYHLKFQRSEHVPLEDNQIRTAHAENDRLKHAISAPGQILQPRQFYLSPGLAKIAPWWLVRRDNFSAKVPGLISADGATNVYSINRRAVCGHSNGRPNENRNLNF